MSIFAGVTFIVFIFGMLIYKMQGDQTTLFSKLTIVIAGLMLVLLTGHYLAVLLP